LVCEQVLMNIFRCLRKVESDEYGMMEQEIVVQKRNWNLESLTPAVNWQS
jgi:hypothetical protein